MRLGIINPVITAIKMGIAINTRVAVDVVEAFPNMIPTATVAFSLFGKRPSTANRCSPGEIPFGISNCPEALPLLSAVSTPNLVGVENIQASMSLPGFNPETDISTRSVSVMRRFPSSSRDVMSPVSDTPHTFSSTPAAVTTS